MTITALPSPIIAILILIATIFMMIVIAIIHCRRKSIGASFSFSKWPSLLLLELLFCLVPPKGGSKSFYAVLAAILLTWGIAVVMMMMMMMIVVGISRWVGVKWCKPNPLRASCIPDLWSSDFCDSIHTSFVLLSFLGVCCSFIVSCRIISLLIRLTIYVFPIQVIWPRSRRMGGWIEDAVELNKPTHWLVEIGDILCTNLWS